MNHPPLKVSFPVIDVGPWCVHFRGPAILLDCAVITPAHVLKDPHPHCNVTGLLQDGRQIQFTIPLNVWRDACERPVTFQSIPGGTAKLGVLFDAQGRPLNRRELSHTGRDSATGVL